MNIITATIRKFHNDEGGAALIMVILITLLLVTASAALLSGVGASSRNNTDALSEAKAYWAAESGIQRVVNVLRHQDVDYGAAAINPDMSNWLTYNGSHQVVVDSEATYEVTVSDPDSSGISTTFNSTGGFATSSTTPYVATYTWFGPTPTPDPSPSPDATPTPSPTPNPNYTQISWIDPAGDTVVNHPAQTSSELGRFHVTTGGTGGTITPIIFRVDYRMSQPYSGVRSIRGEIIVEGGVPKIKFNAFDFDLAGAPILLCADQACAAPGTSFPPVAFNPADQPEIPVYIRIGPAEPTRLKVVATGYGPNRARKQLEAIIQKNYFNNFSVANAITMVGPTTDADGNPCMVFQVGASAQMFIDGGNAPSIGVADENGVQIVNTALDQPQIKDENVTPDPAAYGDELPDWQGSPTILNDLISDLRQQAKNDRRYFLNTSPTNQQGWGCFEVGPNCPVAGTGLTFCEGDCTMGGNQEGGGILVVTGTFYTSGNPKFKGMVLAVGPYRSPTQPGGIIRGGGGNELFTGGLVIAPYFPENLGAGFGCPRYIQNGGPGDTTNQALDETFNETETVTNIVRGVAEK